MHLRRVLITVFLVLLFGASSAWAAIYNAPDTAYNLSGEVGISPWLFNMFDMTWDYKDDAIYMSTNETTYCGYHNLMRYYPGTDTFNNNLNNSQPVCQWYPDVWNLGSLAYDPDNDTIYGGSRASWWGGFVSFSIDTDTFNGPITPGGNGITWGDPQSLIYDSAGHTVYSGTYAWDGPGGDFLTYNPLTGGTGNLAGQLQAVWGPANWSDDNVYAVAEDTVNHVIYIGGNLGKLASYNTVTGAMQNLDVSSVMGQTPVSSLAFDQASGTLYFSGGNLFGAYHTDGTVSNLASSISSILGANGIGKIIAANGFVYIGGGGGKFLKYNISTGLATDLTSRISSFWGTNTVTTMTFDAMDDAVFLGGTYGMFARYNVLPQAPLVINATVSPKPDLYGWNNTNVTVSFACSGGTGSIQCPSPVTISTEGANQTVSGTAVDSSGDSVSTSVTVNIDKTPPSITASLNPQPNTYGWNNTSVTVSFTCNDALSGIAACPSPVTLATEGANQAVAGSATDKAGNSASASVSVNIDETRPVITITGITSGATYILGLNVPTAGYYATDALSGVATSGANLTGGDGFGLGSFTYKATATDKAGNKAGKAAHYTVIATPAGTAALVSQYLSTGVIVNNGIATSLISKLNNAQADFSRGNVNAGDNLMQAFLNEVKTQTGISIGQYAAAVLVDCANYIINHNG